MNEVILRRCEEYDRDRILAIVKDGMRELGYAPKGKVFVKPNVVFASKNAKLGDAAYTNRAVVNAAMVALSNSDGVTRVDMGENTGIGVPTRLNFKNAGYFEEMKRIRKDAGSPVRLFCIDEDRRDELFVGGRVHHTLRVARTMARADSKVYLPKLKCHNVTNVTGAVKLNIGICSDDERAIRHDFLLIDKIVDLLVVGYPDFIVMDAIDIGVANEAIPQVRKLGLIIMGRNPVAVDLVASRLLGYGIKDIPYLKRAVERGYLPARLEDVKLRGDITTIRGLDEQAKRVMPYDDEFYRWQDIHKEMARLRTPIRFHWGYSKTDDKSRCEYGCVMGLKMFLSIAERYAGPEVFAKARPATLVIGKVEETIDARGGRVFFIGSCSDARLVNAGPVTRIKHCFTTTSDLNLIIGTKLGLPSPFLGPSYLLPYLYNVAAASMKKHANLRYLQDVKHFLDHGLMKKI